MTRNSIPALVTFMLLLCFPRQSFEVENVRKKIDLKANAPHAVRKHEASGHAPHRFTKELEEKAYYALKYIHHQMDDDHSGNVDLQESDEFIREELDNAHGLNRQEKFHQNDFQISVQELWFSFKKSALYNWTTDDVIVWLNDHVDLPQYAPVFRAKGILGLHLPLLAANQDHYFTKTMGRFPVDAKRKIILKATDAVVFGPPSWHDSHSLLKDVVLLCAIVVASTCAWMADNRSKRSKRDLSAMQLKMEALSKTESDLRDLQEQFKTEERLTVQLERSREKDVKEKECLMEEINKVEAVADKLKSQRLNSEEMAERLRLAEEELEQVRFALHHVEMELSQTEEEDDSSIYLSGIPKDLFHLLRKTYQRELNSYQSHRSSAEKQLAEAKAYCLEVRKKQGSVFTLMRPHVGLNDTANERICDARHAFEELGENLQERRRRWQRIEAICGVSFRMDGDRHVNGLDVIDERESMEDKSTRKSRDSFSSSSSLRHQSIASSRMAEKRRSVASTNESSSAGDGSPLGNGSPILSRANAPVTFFLNEISNSSTCDLSSSTLSLSSANPRRPSDLAFLRSSTLPKGHSRFGASGLKGAEFQEPGFLRTSSETALFSPDDEEDSIDGRDESRGSSPPGDSALGSSPSQTASAFKSNKPDGERASPSSTLSSPASPELSPQILRGTTQRSSIPKKAKKLISKIWSSREKLNDTGKEDKRSGKNVSN